ncbi:MAG: GNAT family N-acetyltransferase [Thermoplasmata archaeon]|nr:GNAT family N-acetyltransferase [Thermoplasmata archaeon]
MAGLVEGLDDDWLNGAAAREPLLHAYAVWDRLHERERTRFVSLREGRDVLAYLLIWHGSPRAPVLHWVGPSCARARLDAIPPRPVLADLVGELQRRRGPLATYEVEVRSLADRAPVPSEDPRARRLSGSDGAAVRAFVAAEPNRLSEGYQNLDLDRVPVFGAFDAGRLVALSKASVALQRVWVLSGILATTAVRGRGFGRAVTSAATRAALTAGARPGLYVRSDNAPAIGLYASMGYEVVGRRAWIDAGAAQPP